MALKGTVMRFVECASGPEGLQVRELLQKLLSNPKQGFPQKGARLKVPDGHGVYIIRDRENAVLHVGRTYRGRAGLRQRLYDHLHGKSSFSEMYLDKKGDLLRNGYTFQFIEVANERQRALLEHFATGWLCPKHLGLGLPKVKMTEMQASDTGEP